MQKRRWLKAVIEAAENETLTLPWGRRAGRAKRKANARARAMAA